MISHSTAIQSVSGQSLYEMDFYAWTQEQVTLLRSQQWQGLDWENLVEELESLGKQQRQELENRLGILFGHLLKWQFQPEQRCNSWVGTIREQQRRIRRLLEKNPSLKPFIPEAIAEGFELGRDLAVQETNLPYTHFPSECPYSLEEALTVEYFLDES